MDGTFDLCFGMRRENYGWSKGRTSLKYQISKIDSCAQGKSKYYLNDQAHVSLRLACTPLNTLMSGDWIGFITSFDLPEAA